MSSLLFILIVLPVLAALACLFVPIAPVRKLLVAATGVTLMAASVALAMKGNFTFLPGTLLGISADAVITVLDFALLGVIFYYAFKHKNLLIQAFTAIQFVALGFFEFVMVDHSQTVASLAADNLSLIMVLIISIVGSLICIYGLPYMDNHEAHLHLRKSKQPRFFFFLVLFLGAMNALVLANNMLWLYFFFEVTTFCSFMLIGHDETPEATRNSLRALLLNSFGGVAFVGGMIWAYTQTGTLDIQAMIAAGPAAGGLLIAIGMLCLAGFTKAAQVPFQSWLLGAMVAPTPVSALLHSSTMVKAGVYVVLRFAPMYQDSFLSHGIALCGAFTFLACAALAVGQSNGKKILAYSTISNLGLIIACAGINTSTAITAAILLILFHAVSKGLLFLCVGTIEQEIGSRDIEDMRGLFTRLPRTAVITIAGILTMLLPPFGVLLGKWMAIEAASNYMFVIIMLALGSAVTVVYWARWAGSLMGSHEDGGSTENQPLFTFGPLVVLCGGAVVLSMISPIIYTGMIAPMLKTAPFAVAVGIIGSKTGAFVVYPLFLLLGAGLIFAVLRARSAGNFRKVAPYLGGVQLGGPNNGDFNGPMNAPVAFQAGNYYLGELFSEQKLTFWVNAAAAALIVLMLGGGL